MKIWKTDRRIVIYRKLTENSPLDTEHLTENSPLKTDQNFSTED